MPERTVGDVIDELTKRQKKCLYYYIDIACRCGVNGLDIERSHALADLGRTGRYRRETIGSLTEEQLVLFHGLIEEACKEYHKNG